MEALHVKANKTGAHSRILDRKYMEEQKEIEKNIMTQNPPWLLNNITYCYKGEHASNNVGQKKFPAA